MTSPVTDAFPRARLFLAFLLVLSLPLHGQVTINEIMAGGSDRLLQYDVAGEGYAA